MHHFQLSRLPTVKARSDATGSNLGLPKQFIPTAAVSFGLGPGETVECHHVWPLGSLSTELRLKVDLTGIGRACGCGAGRCAPPASEDQDALPKSRCNLEKNRQG